MRAGAAIGGAALAALIAAPGFAHDREDGKGHMLGPGVWTCAQTLQNVTSDDEGLKNAALGFVLGAWSYATLSRPPEFDALIQRVGGVQLLQLTLQACETAPPGTLLGEVIIRSVQKTTDGLPGQ